MSVDGREMQSFVGELDDGTLDSEHGAWLQPLVHVLSDHPALVFLDEKHKFTLMFRLQDRCIRADDRFAFLVKQHIISTSRCAHKDE
jgi:hypothetical protein